MTVGSPVARVVLVMLVALTVTVSMCIGSGLGKGAPAPDFSERDVDGITHRLADYEGRVLVIEFFATWCTYCTDQLPIMEKVREDHPEDQLSILSVDGDDRESRERVAEYRVKHDIQWPVVYKAGTMAEDYMVDAYPTTVVIDGEGVVQYYHAGTVSERGLVEAVEEAL